MKKPILRPAPLEGPLTFAFNQSSCVHLWPSTSIFGQIIDSPVKMCFPCWKYEDVYFEERPKSHKVNKHPLTGTIYAGYYAPRPMVPASMVPISYPIVPALLPVGPAAGPATTSVSYRTISLRSNFLSQLHKSSWPLHELRCTPKAA
jgi:hypothetical protein